MSEWYENKTIEQLDGKRVRVECVGGTAIEGFLQKIDPRMLQIRLSADQDYEITVLDNLADKKQVSTFNDNIKCVTLLDDDMTRIDNTEDVRVGDTFVAADGNRYEVTDIDVYHRDARNLQIKVAHRNIWVYDTYFAYALRPTPQLPTEPGLYMDTDSANRLWIRTWSKIDGVYWRSVQDNNGMPIADLYTDEKMLAELHGATLYPVEIKRVES